VLEIKLVELSNWIKAGICQPKRKKQLKSEGAKLNALKNSDIVQSESEIFDK